MDTGGLSQHNGRKSGDIKEGNVGAEAERGATNEVEMKDEGQAEAGLGQPRNSSAGVATAPKKAINRGRGGKSKEQERATMDMDVDQGMDGITDLMASIKLVPRSVRFGRRGGGMTGFSTQR